MAILKDSGARKEFETGAVRDIREGKGRCDLLPLDVISAHCDDGVLDCVACYMKTGNYNELWKAMLAFNGIYFDKDEHDEYLANLYSMLLDVSIHYEDGAAKYEPNNWKKGIPLHCYIDSGVRHYFKYMRGDTDEPHNRAFVWNILGAMWTHKNRPDMIDIEFGYGDDKEIYSCYTKMKG